MNVYKYLSIFGFLLILFSCREYQPAPLEGISDLPGPPAKITVKLGNGYTLLEWPYEMTASVKEFRVYRSETEPVDFALVGSTDTTSYRDSSLVSGTKYYYQVAAVNERGFEGPHSEAVSVVSALYSILLEGGASVTNKSTVTIDITAPATTQLMMFANDSTFANASWEAFFPKRIWKLSPGDGVKIVYARFRTEDNRETERAITGRIVLDTIASIEFLEEDSGGEDLASGDTLHIRMKTGELDGVATAAIIDPAYDVPGRGAAGIRLYDDGTHGDAQAEDGIYETDYFIGHGLEVENAYLYGDFTDAVGNVAPRAYAENRLTINKNPTSVVLQEPTVASSAVPALILRWSPNTDVDFASYQIMRSTSYLVSLSSTLVAEIRDASVTTYTDSGLEPAMRYYYRIYVFDRGGNVAAGNVVSAMTAENDPPKPVVLAQPLADSLGLTLTWSPSTEEDFANYRLYRSTTTPVDTSFAPIQIINDSSITQFRDLSVSDNTDYYYQIFVYDRYGLSAGSNIVRGRLGP